MPKRTDIHGVLIIGAGPIVIGRACEFDYSGAQARKALRAEGFRRILVNSNPATIMTDPGLADATDVEITSQNHGFAVAGSSLPAGVRVTHVSLFDGTNEGIACDGFPLFSVQYHPEASPGPSDSDHLFARFVGLMAST